MSHLPFYLQFLCVLLAAGVGFGACLRLLPPDSPARDRARKARRSIRRTAEAKPCSATPVRED